MGLSRVTKQTAEATACEPQDQVLNPEAKLLPSLLACSPWGKPAALPWGRPAAPWREVHMGRSRGFSPTASRNLLPRGVSTLGEDGPALVKPTGD